MPKRILSGTISKAASKKTVVVEVERTFKHPIYKKKEFTFNSPAFNFDEVVKLPNSAVCLASNNTNKTYKTRVGGPGSAS